MPTKRTDDAPFFVVGNDRSGTTLLRLALDRSAEAAVPPESMSCSTSHRSARGGLEDPDKAARFVAAVWSHPRVRLWELASEPPAVPAGLTHAEAYRFAVEAPFRAYAQARGQGALRRQDAAVPACRGRAAGDLA